jgi:hypothetical protein
VEIEHRLGILKRCPSHVIWDYRCRRFDDAVQTLEDLDLPYRKSTKRP